MTTKKKGAKARKGRCRVCKKPWALGPQLEWCDECEEQYIKDMETMTGAELKAKWEGAQ